MADRRPFLDAVSLLHQADALKKQYQKRRRSLLENAACLKAVVEDLADSRKASGWNALKTPQSYAPCKLGVPLESSSENDHAVIVRLPPAERVKDPIREAQQRRSRMDASRVEGKAAIRNGVAEHKLLTPT